MADSPNNIVRFLEAILASVQDVENALQQLYRERRIDTAIGAQLDIIGKIVGQPRGELDDDDYRRYCRARIATNRSNGTAQDVIRVARLVLGDDTVYIEVHQEQIATCVVRLITDALDTNVATITTAFLKQTVAAGVRLIVEFTPLAEAETFSFEDGDGLGFGSTLDASVGGGLSSALD